MGNQHTSVIEINGKQYDARTGKLLSGTAQLAHVSKTKPAVRSMDVSRTPRHTSEVHKQTERSKTLMRHAVKKPAPKQPSVKAKTIAKSAVMTDIAAPARRALAAMQPARLKIDEARLARAEKIKQSNLVRKFNDFTPAQKRAATQQTQRTTIASSRTATPATPIKRAPVQPTPSRTRTESIIEQGLKSAQSHQQPAHKVPRRARRTKKARFASIGALSLAVLLLGAFFTYQNIPQLSMRYAASRAGIQAQLPGYRPSGFALSNRIQYTSGQITLSFKSNTDERNFTITQRSSNWNSETLRNNYVATVSDQIQTYEDKGRTIYIYNGSNATWVNGGVWYEIKGNSQLNSDQLVRIATSM